MFDRYARLMFNLNPLPIVGEKQNPRIYKTKAVAKRRAKNKVARKSRRINVLVANHLNKR